MPRRKKLPSVPNYTGGAKRNPERMLIQKSTPLQTLSETGLTLAEFKILDAYLSRINSHRPDERYVRFERGELEKLLGVTKINKDDLSKRIDNLFQVVTIRDPNKPKGFTKIGLFEKAVCEQDDNGQWQVDLACSASAMEYVFNIENLKYLKYRLKNVIDLKSRYSYILYLHLEQHYRQKSWETSLTDLKQLLNCTADTYNEYKRFNDLVLKKCYKEIIEKTDIQFSYEPIKKGRTVTAIRFIVRTQSDEERQLTLETRRDVDDNQLTLDDLTAVDESSESCGEDKEQAMIEKYGSEQLALLAEYTNYEFSKAEIEEIFSILTRINIPRDPTTHDLQWGRVFYLREKYAALNVAAEKAIKNGKPIKQRYAYFKKMLEQDAHTPVAYE